MSFEAFDVVTVPFPFADASRAKRRPALVLSSSKSFGSLIGHSVLAMITSAKNSQCPLDVVISDLEAAGLPSESIVRMKIFTLDHRFIVTKIGALAKKDQSRVKNALGELFTK